MRSDKVRKEVSERAGLEAAYAEMRAEVAVAGPSPGVKERVLAELRAAGMASPAGSTRRTWSWVAASAVVLVVVVLAASPALHQREWRSARVESTGSVGSVSKPVAEAFTAMPYVVPPAPYERTTVVRTEVPVQTMVAAGFDVHGTDLSSRTQADVLYGEDGRILAIRLISHTNFSTKRID